MSEKTWTPESWRQEQGTTLVWGAYDPDGKSTWGMGVPVVEARIHERVREDEAMANAARLVACVNACAGIANPEKAIPAVVEAFRDMLSGWHYIRQHHGDLYGVGWDRAETKASAALALVKPPYAAKTVH